MLRLRSPREIPLLLPMNVLLLRWDTKPDSASGGRSYVEHRHAEHLSMPLIERCDVLICR
jgi:hypothetical protein